VSPRKVKILTENVEFPFKGDDRTFSAMMVFDSVLYLLKGNSNEIYAYNIESIGMPKVIPLPSSLDFKAKGSPLSFYVHNKDSIFLQQEYQFSLVDSKGNVTSTWSINTDKEPETYLYKLSSKFNLIFSQKENKLYTERFSTYYAEDPKYRITYGVEAGLNLKTLSVDTIPVIFPLIYQSGYFGFADEIGRCVNGTLHVYNFMLSSDILTFDVLKKRAQAYPGKSSYQKKSPIGLSSKMKDDTQLKMENMIQQPIYFDILYDKWRHVYYRFFYQEQPETKNDGTYNVWADKKFIIQIFDEHFRIIKELPMENNVYGNDWFVGRQGLYVSRLHYKNHEAIHKASIPFTIIKFNDEEGK
jgi:hypothetical protein